VGPSTPPAACVDFGRARSIWIRNVRDSISAITCSSPPCSTNVAWRSAADTAGASMSARGRFPAHVVARHLRGDRGLPEERQPSRGAVAAPTAVPIRPDGHVAWVSDDGADQGLRDALDYVVWTAIEVPGFGPSMSMSMLCYVRHDGNHTRSSSARHRSKTWGHPQFDALTS